jgi:hypothetical protein
MGRFKLRALGLKKRHAIGFYRIMYEPQGRFDVIGERKHLPLQRVESL